MRHLLTLQNEEQDAVSKSQVDEINNNLRENVFLPSFGGAGGGQALPDSDNRAKSLPGYITADLVSYKYLKEIRRGLKENYTEAEKLMWKYLQNKKTGFKIRRQHVIDNFIVDFVCLPTKLVIEIDGKIHL